jgi:anti-sigma factor RsiW
MNPDKLFDYLDGRLSAAERAAMEEQLISDRQLQRELTVARQIHLGARGDSREVCPSRSRCFWRAGKWRFVLALRLSFSYGVNVGIGLWLIARHETKNPNRALLEAQMRQQITKALEHAATTLTPAPFSVGQITIPTTPRDDWTLLPTKSSQSLANSGVPRRKGFQTKIVSAFLSIFRRITRRDFARRSPP